MQLDDAFDNPSIREVFEGMNNQKKKEIVETFITQALEQMELEGRNPTISEAERLSIAIGTTFTGLYRVALNEVFLLSTDTEDEAARPEHWWQESEDITLTQLKDALSYVKGAQAR